MTSTTGRITRFLLKELVGELLRFPVWWYSQGLVLAWRRMERQWFAAIDRTGIRFLLINMGKPMYGDYTRSGRVISFFFRVILVLWSLIIIGLWSGVVLAIFFTWILALLVAAGMLLRQLLPV